MAQVENVIIMYLSIVSDSVRAEFIKNYFLLTWDKNLESHTSWLVWDKTSLDGTSLYHHCAKFGCHEHCGSGDMFLVSCMIWQDHMIE